MHLSKELTEAENDELLSKAKNVVKLEDILKVFTHIPVHPLWPMDHTHASSVYNRDFSVPLHTFLDYNAWNSPREIDIPYHPCNDKEIKYARSQGKPDLKLNNPHYFPMIFFMVLEKHAHEISTYPYVSSYQKPKTKDERREYWKQKRLRGLRTPHGQVGGQAGLVPFNLLDQNYYDLFTDYGLTDVINFI